MGDMDLTVIWVTLRVAAAATAVNFPLALGLAWLMVRKRIRGRFLVDLLVSLPLALPPVAVGYFLLLLLGREGPVGSVLHGLLGVDLVFTWIAAALAAAVVSFPLMARAVMVAMEGVDQRLEASARSLGAGPVRVFFTITVPLAYTGILAGVLLGFVRALGGVWGHDYRCGQHPRQDSDAAAGYLHQRAVGGHERGGAACGSVDRTSGCDTGRAQLAAGAVGEGRVR